MDSYAVSAKYYDDAYAAEPDLVDLLFYLDLAKQFGGPVLEIACGTGRILLPIARAGIEINGVDKSSSMLQVLREQLEREPAEIRNRVTISKGDMRTFRLSREFPLVTIPFRPMQHMHTLPDQVAALETAAVHLAPGGILAFDVFYPNYDLMFSRIGQEVLEMEWPLRSDPTKIVRRSFRKYSVDKVNQIFCLTFIFRTYEGDRVVKQETESLKLCYYTYPHMRALFVLAGLEVVEEYGSCAKTPLDNSAEQMIFVLRRARRG